MERVQYQLERSIPQLQLLDENKVFSKDELRSITSQRQSHESRLIRRQPEKLDYVRYIDFEDNLSILIGVKAHRLELNHKFIRDNASAHTAHIVSIFERLVTKFKYDVDCWERYIQWANRRKMRVVVGRVYARALSLHPAHVPLWLSAASHELNANSSPTAARTLLQRALRINALPWKKPTTTTAGSKRKAQDDGQPDDKKLRLEGSSLSQSSPAEIPTSGPPSLKLSVRERDLLRLWVEYFRMELVFIERLRRRWMVLGIRWDDDETLQGSKYLEADSDQVQSAASDLDGEASGGSTEEAADDEGEDQVLLSAVPEREAEAVLSPEDQPPPPSSAGGKKGSGGRVGSSSSSSHSISPAQISILRGSIPMLLFGNALKTLPPTLHFVLLLSLLELFRNFPFADARPQSSSTGGISGSKSKSAISKAAAADSKSGNQLRQRLIKAVYDAMGERERWGWKDFTTVSLVLASRGLKDAEVFIQTENFDLEEGQDLTELADGIEEELETNDQLRKASLLRTKFSEDVDGLLDRAEWLRIGGAPRSSKMFGHTSTPLAQKLALYLLESSLVNPSTSKPSPLFRKLARKGLLTQAVRLAVETLKPLCDQAPVSMGSFPVKSEFFNASLRLLDLLSDPSRSGIDEPNLLRYLEVVTAELIADAKGAGEGVESSAMRAMQVGRKLDTIMAVQGGEIGGEGDKKLRKLEKLAVEVRACTSGKSQFKHSSELWRLRIQIAQARQSLSPIEDSVQEAARTRDEISYEWAQALAACRVGEDDTDLASGEDIEETVASGLWFSYLRWIEEEGNRIAGVDLEKGTVGGSKSRRKAAKWAQEQFEAAIKSTGSELSRPTDVNKSVHNKDLITVGLLKQATHDLVLERYLSFTTAIDGLSHGAGERRVGDETVKAVDVCSKKAFGSAEFWKSAIEMIRRVLGLGRQGDDETRLGSDEAANGERKYVSLPNGIQYLVDRMYAHLLMQTSRRSSSKVAVAAMPINAVSISEAWLMYLEHLMVDRKEVTKALEGLERARKDCLNVSSGAEKEIKELERGWEKLCENGSKERTCSSSSSSSLAA
ncbi:hypothetical protein IE53DRAFT_385906 [Violaceomyces palustris]|uniref:Uncharacterized protein n=1 Tax=Violaceomyces palustris TaxID=1673888 RepID=A0ACD0P0V4_9BASI|nr:hypothetical protein IE53DRAFT_385906 [Violaceomyces palustris]